MDNEPATRQVLKLLVQARTAIGLETHMRTTKLYDSSGNSLAENAVQRIRGVQQVSWRRSQHAL